jgi:hypothetical protein
VLLAVVLTACASRVSGGERTILIASGTSTSQWYPLSAGICHYITEYDAVAQVTSGGIENGTLVGQLDMGFGLINSNAAYSAKNGAWPYAETYDISAVAQLYTCAVQIVVFDDSDITSVEDLRGRRVVLSPAGSSLYMAALDILAAYGISEQDLHGVKMSYSEGVTAMRDGHCDAMIVIMPMPNSSITELALVKDVRLLPIDRARELADTYPYFTCDTIAADYYGPTDTASNDLLPTVRLGVTLIVNNQVPDGQVEAVLQSIFDHQEQLGAIQAVAKEIDLQRARQTPIALHPAAEAFYAQREAEGGTP